jgi:type II restriction/modification system DNA methylase subunit YeeA
MISSGPKGGFRALFYIHRYTPDLLARIRTDYVHEQQERYRSRISELERQRDGAARGQVGAMDRELRSLRAKLEETNGFEERLHHLADQMVEIDLDDGVKANYERLRDVLARIR